MIFLQLLIIKKYDAISMPTKTRQYTNKTGFTVVELPEKGQTNLKNAQSGAILRELRSGHPLEQEFWKDGRCWT